MDESQKGRRWLGVQVPAWPIAAMNALNRVQPDEPVALLEAGRVVALSVAASAQGLQRGMTQASASARGEQVVFLPRDRNAEIEAFTAVTSALDEISASLYQLRPGFVLIPLRQRDNQMKDESALVEVAVETVVAHTLHEARAGIATGLLAAVAATQTERIIAADRTSAFLDPLPIGVLEQLSRSRDESEQITDVVTTLKDLGVVQVGQFTRWEPGQVSTQFAQIGQLLHLAARGEDWPLSAVEPPAADLDVSVSFDPPLLGYEQLLFRARAALDELLRLLTNRGLACQELSVIILDESGVKDERCWQVNSHEVERLRQSLRWQFEGWLANEGQRKTKAALERLILRAHRPFPAALNQSTLWQERASHYRALRAAHRISAMAGEGVLLRPTQVGSSNPRLRITTIPWLIDQQLQSEVSADSFQDAAAPWPGQLPGPYPAITPAEPVPAQVSDHTQRELRIDARGRIDGEPVWLYHQEQRHRITHHKGPWIFHERWWQSQPAYALIHVQIAGGPARLLSFTPPQAWAVEGIYG